MQKKLQKKFINFSHCWFPSQTKTSVGLKLTQLLIHPSKNSSDQLSVQRCSLCLNHRTNSLLAIQTGSKSPPIHPAQLHIRYSPAIPKFFGQQKKVFCSMPSTIWWSFDPNIGLYKYVIWVRHVFRLILQLVSLSISPGRQHIQAVS